VDEKAVRKLRGVVRVESEPTAAGARLRLATTNVEDTATGLKILASEQGWKLNEVRRQRQTLEDLFVRIVERDGAEEPATV
jgi:hypothetical protein